jgi:hypothetical protein
LAVPGRVKKTDLSVLADEVLVTLLGVSKGTVLLTTVHIV